MSDVEQIEAHLRARGCEFLPEGEFLLPHYDGLGIANLPATLAALLGAELPGACPPLRADLWADWGEVRRVVLLVVDALGYLQLRAALNEWTDEELDVLRRLCAVGRLVPITSTFLSTTNTVLTTLWSGYSPAAHGILAYELYLRELGVAASPLMFWPVYHRRRDALVEWGLKADEFVPVPGLAECLADQGIRTCALIRKAYADSFLAQIHKRGIAETEGFVATGDMWLEIGRLLDRHTDEKLLIFAYWDPVDSVTHRYGPDDDAWRLELRAMAWSLEHGFLARLTPARCDGTLLILTADHGGIATPREAAVHLQDHPHLYDVLSLPPLGESRVPFLHVRGDALEQAQSYLRDQLGDCFFVLTREQVLASGLLGPGKVYAEVPHRLGDLIALARGDHYLARDERQLEMKGRHGGLSPQEMLVPLLGVRLDAW